EHPQLLVDLGVPDRRLAGLVEVAPRVVRQQVEDRLDPDLAQRPGPLGADAPQLGDGEGRQLTEATGHGDAGYSIPNRYGYRGWPPGWTSAATSGRCSPSHSVSWRVQAAEAPSPSMIVTISWRSVTSTSRSAVAAEARSRSTALMPSRPRPSQSPVWIGP